MNQKKAKELRKAVRMFCQAQEQTMPYRQLVVALTAGRPLPGVDASTLKRTLKGHIDHEQEGAYPVYTVVNSRQSFRGLYRALKKAARK
jgi:hypothetical protein